MVIAVITLLVFLAAVVSCIFYPSLTRLIAVGVVAVIWILVNGPIEGAVLYRFNEDHGLTVADLAVLAVIPAGVRFLRAVSREHHRSNEQLETSASKSEH